jgi:hypothetical protein
MCESSAELPVRVHAMVGGTNFFPSRKEEMMKVSEEGRFVEEMKKVKEEKDNTGKIRVTQTT